jgi:four helix bundle protein
MPGPTSGRKGVRCAIALRDALFWFFFPAAVSNLACMIEWPCQRLEAWKLAREFAHEMSALARCLPPFEKYALAIQIVRAARSVHDNVAEGNSASGPGVHQRHVGIALGSLGETDNHLITAMDEGYITRERCESYRVKGWRLRRVLLALLKSLRNAR